MQIQALDPLSNSAVTWAGVGVCGVLGEKSTVDVEALDNCARRNRSMAGWFIWKFIK
jgi:hypothetical protein